MIAIVSIKASVLMLASPSYSLHIIFFYCCSVTIVPISSPLLSLSLLNPTSHIQLPSPTWSLTMCTLYMFLGEPLFSPVIPLPPQLWSLSVCSFLFNFHFFKNELIYFYSVTIVCIFSTSLQSNPASPTSLPHLYPPNYFVHVSFIVAPIDPSPHYTLPTPLWLLLQCS